MIYTLAARWEGTVDADSEAASLRRGDPEALAALITRYQNRLYRFLLRMVREPATADDLFQQTWLRIAQRIHQYKPRHSFEAWMFTLARNLAIDHLRRQRPESLDEVSENGVSRAELLSSSAPSALETLLTRERSDLMLAALDELPLRYREPLVLRFEEEMKLEEIAQVTGAPLSTVKTRVARGLELMRRSVERKFSAGVSE